MARGPGDPPAPRRRARSARRGRPRARRSASGDTPFTHDELVAAAPTSTRSSACSPTASIARCSPPAPAGCASSRTSRSATTTSTSRAATERGIAVCNTPGVLDETTADLAFLLILAASAARVRRRGRPARRPLGGLGDQPVPRPRRARRGARPGRVRPHRPGGRPPRRGLRHGGAPPHAPRHRACPATSPTSTTCSAVADIVSLHVPLSDATRHLIGAPELGLHEADRGAREHRRGVRWSTRSRSPRRSRRDDLRRRARRVRARAGGRTRGCSPRRARCCSRTSASASLATRTRMARRRERGRPAPCSPGERPTEPRGLSLRVTS